MRIIFMGTPEIGADVLRTLAKRYEVAGVFCQTDKPVGRKQILTPPPVKVAAQELGLQVYQPKSVRKQETLDLIRSLEPDLVCVVAYGKILPGELLKIPKYGCFNLHGSLLPAYRGSAPIQRSIIDGNPVGMTVMCMAEECDAGDILAQRELALTDEDDAYTVFDKMGKIGGDFMADTIEGYLSGEIKPQVQDHSKATFADMLEKEEAIFSFSADARQIVNKVKGMSMWPVASFEYDGKKIKVRTAKYSSETGEEGTVLSLKPFTVAAKDGSVVLLKVVPEGGKEMGGEDWARGRRFKVGDKPF